jgi:hypothetical protein
MSMKRSHQPIAHPPDDVSMESHSAQGKTEELGEKPVPVPLRQP